MAKIKLSETIHFFPISETAHNNEQPLVSELQLSIENNPLAPGDELDAQLQGSFAGNLPTRLDCLTVSLEGRIAQGEDSTAFVHAAEIAHDYQVSAGSRFTQPVSIQIPHDALPSSAEVTWKLVARAVWETSQNLQDEMTLTVVPEPAAE